jgi:hypothetical protein
MTPFVWTGCQCCVSFSCLKFIFIVCFDHDGMCVENILEYIGRTLSGRCDVFALLPLLLACASVLMAYKCQASVFVAYNSRVQPIVAKVNLGSTYVSQFSTFQGRWPWLTFNCTEISAIATTFLRSNCFSHSEHFLYSLAATFCRNKFSHSSHIS